MKPILFALVSSLAVLSLSAFLGQGDEPQKPLLPDATVKPSSPQVLVVQGADPKNPTVSVKIAGGADAYPGIAITPKAGKWDLSAFGHVEALVLNSGAEPIDIALRVDNAGNWQDNPWNSEQTTIPPGKPGLVETFFGYSYGFKKDFALNPSAVVGLVIFTKKTGKPVAFRILRLLAGGRPNEGPPVPPEERRSTPPSGLATNDAAVTATRFGPDADDLASDRNRFALDVPTFVPTAVSRLGPRVGRWDLSGYTDVLVRVRNRSATPVLPRARVESNGGNSAWFGPSKPIAGHAETEIAVPFSNAIDLNGSKPSEGITSDAVKDVEVAADQAVSPQSLEVESIQGVVKTAALPAWVGVRPPAPGDWVKTLDDEFDGHALNRAVWSAVGENYYDKVTHWSTDDLIVGGGVARLRYEKKTGFQNDDPKRNSTAYAAGFLNSYGLWTQRYGYFEARMKVPLAPGLWPAFWMMPDRGFAAGPEQWKRQDTANGGMEFDVMEHLSRWGPYRYNIAMHYDGYAKDHKSLGSEKIYVRPDKDGFITCGLLWTPGEAVYYCNGEEVLRWKSLRIANVPSTIMFTIPSGGWDNNQLDDRQLPADFVIDYVRVWQRHDLMNYR